MNRKNTQLRLFVANSNTDGNDSSNPATANRLIGRYSESVCTGIGVMIGEVIVGSTIRKGPVTTVSILRMVTLLRQCECIGSLLRRAARG